MTFSDYNVLHISPSSSSQKHFIKAHLPSNNIFRRKQAMAPHMLPNVRNTLSSSLTFISENITMTIVVLLCDEQKYCLVGALTVCFEFF